MEAPNTQQEKYQGKPRKTRKWLKVLLVVVGILIGLKIVVILLIPSLVSSGKARQMILARANKSMDGKVDFATLSMGWFKGIEVRGISFEDKARSISVAVKQVATMPHYAALLTGGLSFGKTVIDEPRIQLNIAEPQKEQVGATTKIAAQAATGEKKAQGVGLPVNSIDLVVNNGDVKVSKGGQTVELAQVNSRVNLRPSGEQSDFDLSATVKDGGKESPVSVKGQIKSGKTGWTMEQTTGNVAVEINDLDLSSVGGLLALAGVDIKAKGVVSANLSGAIKEGKLEKAEGAISGAGLEVTGAALKGDTIRTSTLEGAVRLTGAANLINIDALRIKSDWIKAEASGVMPTTAGSLEEFVKPDSKYALKASFECDVPAVLSQLKQTLGLKEQIKITGGKLSGNVETITDAGRKALAATVNLGGLQGTIEGKPITLSEPIVADAKIVSQQGSLGFEKLGVTSAFAKVDLSGSTSRMEYTAQVDLGKFQSELGQFVDLGGYKMAGEFASKGKIARDAKRTAIECLSELREIRVSSPNGVSVSEPRAAVGFAGTIDQGRNVAEIASLTAETSFGRISVKDAAVPLGKDGAGAMSANITAESIDLAKLQPYAVMFGGMRKDVQIEGKVDGQVRVTSDKGTYRIFTDSAKVSNLRIAGAGEQPFVQEQVLLVFDGESGPAKNGVRFEVASPNIKIKGNFEQKAEGQTSSLQGKAELDYDWKAITGMLSPFMPAGLVLEGKRQDAISIASRYRAGDNNDMLANLNAQGRVGFDRAGYMGLEVGKSNVDIKVDKGLLTIAPFSTTVNNGQLNFGGQADFRAATAGAKKGPVMFRTPGAMNIIKDVRLNDEIANKLLARINPIFSGAVQVDGVANFNCSRLVVPIKGGRAEDVDIAGTISLMPVNMKPVGLLGAILAAMGGAGGSMAIHPTQFTVKDGFVRYTDMQLDIGDNPVNFSGVVPLDVNRQIENFSVTLPYSAAGKLVRTGQESSARRITAYVKGTPKNPQLDIGKMAQEELLQTGLEILLEKAGKK